MRSTIKMANLSSDSEETLPNPDDELILEQFDHGDETETNIRQQSTPSRPKIAKRRRTTTTTTVESAF